MSEARTDTERPTGPVATLEREPVADRPAREPDPGTVRLVRAGEVLVTLGVILLLFVGYEVWVTNWLSQDRQDGASEQLVRDWAATPPVAASAPVAGPPVPVGAPMARLTLPTLGLGWAVIEGTGQDELRTGPGHYVDSAAPGMPGNFAVAGHRVGRGAPFDRVDELRSCAPLVVETAQGWAVYRVLPHADEVAGWAEGRGRAAECRGLRPLDGVPGREVVSPRDVGVIAPVPNRPEAGPAEPLITLTTCHPRFSARERLVVHGALDRFVPKTAGGALPAELVAPATEGE